LKTHKKILGVQPEKIS